MNFGARRGKAEQERPQNVNSASHSLTPRPSLIESSGENIVSGRSWPATVLKPQPKTRAERALLHPSICVILPRAVLDDQRNASLVSLTLKEGMETTAVQINTR